MGQIPLQMCIRDSTDTIADLRQLTRDLRPSYLDDLGLVPALGLLAREATAGLGIPIEFMSSGEPRRLPPPVELAAYRIAQEALRNAGRHARAAHASVTLDFITERATLTVSDDGVGFDAGRVGELALGGHFGLPVSYTHLDVYKRQRPGGGMADALA